MIKLVLCSMVRNESRVIRRMIESARPFCSAMVITDTGSTDNTVQICQELGCIVYESPFENFGKSRTKSIENAISYVKLNPETFDPSNTFLLLLDADMVLKKKEGVEDLDLKNFNVLKNKYCLMLRQTDESSSYYNIRMIRTDIDWHVVGNTHEHTTTKKKGLHVPRDRYDELWIDDRNDGGFKFDKLERDLRLLLQGLYSCDGEHVRYLFYIAQTYMTLGKTYEAKKFLTLRIDHPDKGYDEEVFLCYLRRGNLQSKEEKRLRDYDLAYSFMPDRIESMIKKAEYLIKKERYEECWETALKHVINTPLPKKRSLFLDIPSYYELRDKLLLILELKKNSMGIKKTSTINKTSIIDKANRLSFQIPKFTIALPFIECESINKEYLSLSSLSSLSSSSSLTSSISSTPSISCPDGRFLAVRFHNYYIRENGTYGCDDLPVRSETNVYDLKQKQGKLNIFNKHRELNTLSDVQGDEDIRLFFSNKNNENNENNENKKKDENDLLLHFTCANLDHIPKKATIATGSLSFNENEIGNVTSYTLYPQLGNQKNWLYCCDKDEYWAFIDKMGNIVTSSDLVHSISTRTLTFTSTSEKQASKHYEMHENFRFSAGPLLLTQSHKSSKEYIVLCHCVENYLPIQERVYYHRFVLVRDNKVVSFSNAFHFQEQEQVEYSCGMGFITLQEYDNLIGKKKKNKKEKNKKEKNKTVVCITFSYRDKTSQAGILDLKTIVEMASKWSWENFYEKRDPYYDLKIADGIF